MKVKKILSAVLASIMLTMTAFSSAETVSSLEIETKDVPNPSEATAKEKSSQPVDKKTSGTSNGLCDNIEDGIILHAWCWSFNSIRENMSKIAEAGYTAVQTSPANACNSDQNQLMVIMGNPNDKKKGDNTSGYDGQLGSWWWHYQPIDWTIGNYQLGTEQDYIDMCEEAHRYGVKIITDIVPNHTASDISKVSQNYINAVTKNGDLNEIYHEEGLQYGNISNNSSRRQSILRNMGGLPDVNTENPKYQEYFLKYCNQLIDDGCDGFRLDTAKHIGLDGDPIDSTNEIGKNNFYDVIFGSEQLKDKDGNIVMEDDGVTPLKLHNRENLFTYAEILEGGDTPYDQYCKYMDLVASGYGYTIRKAVRNSSLSADSLKSLNHTGNIAEDRLITWVESHDNYCNDHESADLTDEQVRLAWAVVAARKNGIPLFFSRPKHSTTTNIWGDNVIGESGNDEFYYDTIKAVNNFHNAMAGEDDSFTNIPDSKVLKIERGSKGACIINIDTSARTLTDVDTNLKDGTYIDRVNGGQFTVANQKLSGSIEEKSVVVIYNTSDLKASPSKGEFTSDSIDVNLSFNELKSNSNATYTITADNYSSGQINFTNNTTIQLGTGIAYNKEITLTLNAVDKNNIPVSKTYKYVKRNENDIKYVYFDNNRFNWNNVYAYIYKSGTTSYNCSWPGVQMTYDPETGYYKSDIPYGMENNYKVVFYSNDTNRYPAYGTTGLLLNGSEMILKYDKSWGAYNPDTDVPDVSQIKEPDRYIYFFDSMGWSDYAIDITLLDASGSSGGATAEHMMWSKELHCYYYGYNSTDGFTKVQFSGKKKSGSTLCNCITEQVSLSPGKLYVPTAETKSNTTLSYTGEYTDLNSIQQHTVYYDNSKSKWDSVNVYTWNVVGSSERKNAVWPGERATYVGNNIYSFITYYPKTSNDIENPYYPNIIFKSENYQTQDLTIPVDSNGNPKINSQYKYKSSTASKEDGSWSNVTSVKSSLPLYFYYIDHRMAEKNNQGDLYLSSDHVTALNAAIQNSDLESSIINSLNSVEDKNLYDEYNVHASQYDYVKSIASTVDIRAGDNEAPLAAFYKPTLLAHSSNVFSGVYKDAIPELNFEVTDNYKWVTYYDENGKELSRENILPNLSNLHHIGVRALSLPKKHGVTFYYPNSSVTESNMISFKNNKLYVAKTNTSVSHQQNYNQLYSDTVSDYTNSFNNMVVPTINNKQAVFDGWYLIKFDSNNKIQSYLKVSSELEYKYRLTSNMDLYAVFAESNSNKKGASIPECEEDIYTDASSSNNTVQNINIYSENTDFVNYNNYSKKYRFNTLLNIYNSSDYSSTASDGITNAAVVYVKLGKNDTFDLEEIKTDIKNVFDGKPLNNTSLEYAKYQYEVGTDVSLTEKNRLQFVLNLTESQVTNDGNYTNVLAFTAFKTSDNNNWVVSDNCINYKNGKPEIVMNTNAAS